MTLKLVFGNGGSNGLLQCYNITICAIINLDSSTKSFTNSQMVYKALLFVLVRFLIELDRFLMDRDQRESR